MLRRCRPLLGTFVEIAVPKTDAAAIDLAFAAIQHIHSRMSFHEEASDLAALRRAPPGETVQVDPETVLVLRFAAELHRVSSGLFDVTVGARLVSSGHLPRPPGIDLRRFTGIAEDIEIVDEAHIRCMRPLLIDLGGIAKGRAVDQAAEALIAAGVEHGIVNAGGDLRVIGELPELIHLRDANGNVTVALPLADAALASSAPAADLRRRLGRPESPHRGYGGRAILDGIVSVVAPCCMIADAMAKIALGDPARAAVLMAPYGAHLVDRSALREAA